MNKLTILFTLLIFFGLIATPALAQDNADNLSASNFFYGVTADNNIAIHHAPDAASKAEAGPVAIDLSASNFFYGQPIAGQAEIIHNTDVRPPRADVVVETGNPLTPAVFFGYTDTIESKEAPCTNC